MGFAISDGEPCELKRAIDSIYLDVSSNACKYSSIKEGSSLIFGTGIAAVIVHPVLLIFTSYRFSKSQWKKCSMFTVGTNLRALNYHILILLIICVENLYITHQRKCMLLNFPESQLIWFTSIFHGNQYWCHGVCRQYGELLHNGCL